MMKAAITSQEKPDITQFAINNSGPVQQPVLKASQSDHENSRDIQEVAEVKPIP
jgi:hypothetical protein